MATAGVWLADWRLALGSHVRFETKALPLILCFRPALFWGMLPSIPYAISPSDSIFIFQIGDFEIS